ncbi:MAG: FAD-binding and (Fe-S)-binding domain-containing protein [Actinomycetia bacterium]|nr:FAD-binding and (Fe-S)-binding domain-containing protein [Actinomycetes bacterium]
MRSDQLQDFRSALGAAAPCVDTTTAQRAAYSSDGSVYRVVPTAVAQPRDTDELLTVLAAARAVQLPVTARGAGTSCAGNAVGAGLVIDLARHLNQVLSIDEQTAVVQPGVVQETLQRAGRAYQRRFGPDPSTSTRCTIGGMVGNNACGPRALGYGTTATNLVDAQVVTGTGELLRLSSAAQTSTGARLLGLVAEESDLVSTEFGRFGRQGSGYALQHLLPGRENLVGFFAGTEGTLGIATELTVRLVADPPHRVMVALGYPTMPEAADAVPGLLPYAPTAVEGLDRRIVEVVRRRRGGSAVPPLPRGDAWLFVEVAGDAPGEVRSRAERLLGASGCREGWLADPAQAPALWRIRSDGAGLAGLALPSPAYGGWEDASVPPDRLGAYLRQFDALLTEHGLHGLPYGHFGDGCVHCRIDFPLTTDDGPARYRAFVSDAADLIASYGGSLSGEHGDGRARSALLDRIYSPAALDLFSQVKSLLDPENLLNPGILVDPAPVEAEIRESQRRGSPLSVAEPDFAAAVHRCTGVGKCVAVSSPGALMCPTYQATHEERCSTRGRARTLQEMVNGELVTGGWRAREVQEALDLCLACKGCRRDCPTGTDMAWYKSQVLDHAYAGRLRPRQHYSLGWLPRWTRLVGRVPGLGRLANLALSLPGVVHLARFAAGVDQRRPLPRFARCPNHQAVDIDPQAPGRPVVVWVDSFTDAFEGTAVEAMVGVLRAAGYAPRFLEGDACCGLTWITTGQLDGARTRLRRALDLLHPVVASGVPVVGLEPSCMAVWRSDAAELLEGDPQVAEVAAGIHTLAELLTQTEGWQPPDLSGRTIVAQPHCHHASVLGWAADQEILDVTGTTVVTVGGCCGLAGSFGVEQGHYAMSLAVAENELLPALRAVGPEAVVLADGFSCRKQVSDLTGRQAQTLAQLLRG